MRRVNIACGRCRVERTPAEWSALPELTEVAAADLEGVVSRWPEHLVVVVRACSCGAPIARSTPRRAS